MEPGVLALYAIASALVVLPQLAGLLALRAARALMDSDQERERRAAWVLTGATGLAMVAHAGIVFWLVGTGGGGTLLRWRQDDGARLVALGLGGVGVLLLAAWAGTLQALVRRSSRHSGELEALNRKLRHRTQELEEFSYAVSHDLRSPLVALEWLLYEIRDEMAVPEQERALLMARITRLVRQMSVLVDDLLLLAQVEREGRTTEPVPVDEVVAEVEENLRPILHRREMVVELDGCTGAQVPMPRTRLKQVVQNLVTNAAHYGMGGGRIRLSCHPEDTPGFLRLEVADDGPGVPMHERERIFQAFARGSNADQESRGIGLALVRKIARAYGGRVWVEDAPEGGACFVVRLPGIIAPVVGPTEDVPEASLAPPL